MAAAGLVVDKASGLRRRPRYDLPPIPPSPPGLGGLEKQVVQLVANGFQPEATARHQRAAEAAERKGYLRRTDAGWEAIAPQATPIWLPNTLIDGAAGETPPFERLRRRRDPKIFMLLADLYLHHDLAEEGGVARRSLYMRSERQLLRRVGGLDVWRFTLDPTARVGAGPDGSYPFDRHREVEEDGRRTWSAFFKRLRVLEEAGLVQWTLHLVEGAEDDHDAAIIAPIGVLEGSNRGSILCDGLDWCVRHNAALAAICLLDQTAEDEVIERMAEEFETASARTLVALDRDYAEVSLMGVLRMRYRPHTAKTAAWYAELTDRCLELIDDSRALIEQHRPQLLVFGDADIKGEIKADIKGEIKADIKGEIKG